MLSEVYYAFLLSAGDDRFDRHVQYVCCRDKSRDKAVIITVGNVYGAV